MTDPATPGIGALVRDDQGNSSLVMLFPNGETGRIATTLRQREPNQGLVELRLTLDGEPLETVSIALPPCPAGEEVQVRICLDELGILDVELQHADVLVERIIRYRVTRPAAPGPTRP